MITAKPSDPGSLKDKLAKLPAKRIVLGAAGRHDAGWVPTEIDQLNLLRPTDWERCFSPRSLDAMLAEHVWEHLTREEGSFAARICFEYLKPNGYLRIAVPDGLHPNPAYIDWVKIGGKGPGAADHKVLYTYETLREVFEEAGFRVVLYEYFDASGEFHYQHWNPGDGLIHRSSDHDPRNRDGKLNYTSIVMDAIKETDDQTAGSRAGWEQLAPVLAGGTALPNYGPLAPTEQTLQLFDSVAGIIALELGCSDGGSLAYLLDHGAAEVWGVDISSLQLSSAASLLQKYSSRVHLINSPMESDCGLPRNYFDVVFSIYALGFTSDLGKTAGLIASYLKPGGYFIFSDEHPVYSCLTLTEDGVIFQEPYVVEGPYRKQIGSGAEVTMHKRTLSSFLNTLVDAGLQVEHLIEGEVNYDVATSKHYETERWYSIPKAHLMPTTFILKARKSATRES